MKGEPEGVESEPEEEESEHEGKEGETEEEGEIEEENKEEGETESKKEENITIAVEKLKNIINNTSGINKEYANIIISELIIGILTNKEKLIK